MPRIPDAEIKRLRDLCEKIASKQETLALSEIWVAANALPLLLDALDQDSRYIDQTERQLREAHTRIEELEKALPESEVLEQAACALDLLDLAGEHKELVDKVYVAAAKSDKARE